MADRLRTFIEPDRIQTRIAELAADLSRDYRSANLMVVGVLKGSFMFLSDLVRRMEIDPIIDFLRVSSYGSATESSGVVEIRKDLEMSVEGMDVLVVEDIVDTGLTLNYLLKHLQIGQPKTLRTCTLLDKPSRRRVTMKPDYVGFEIPDHFVVGFGLDYDEKYRHLPAICILEQNGP